MKDVLLRMFSEGLRMLYGGRVIKNVNMRYIIFISYHIILCTLYYKDASGRAFHQEC